MISGYIQGEDYSMKDADKKLIESLEDQIVYLRKENERLVDLMECILSNKPLEQVKVEKDKTPLYPVAVNPMGILQSLEAKTDEEKAEKKLAERQLQDLMAAM